MATVSLFKDSAQHETSVAGAARDFAAEANQELVGCLLYFHWPTAELLALLPLKRGEVRGGGKKP